MRIPALVIRLVALLMFASPSVAAGALPGVRADGTRMVDASSGKPITLRGCNLGNWLMIEPWMLGGCLESRDQGQITDILRQRFGDERGYGLMELYRAGYVTPRDFELLKSFGFNIVRLPFDYRLLMDEKAPYAMRPDAFRWLDRALEMAEAAGVYVILDMHGVPSGQSNQMHTGRANQEPEIYDDPPAQQRMLELWTAIASRYKDRSIVAAYDIMNEPYGDYKTDVREPVRQLMFRAYDAVRSSGDQHVILFPSTLGKGIYFYGDVRARGFRQIAFTDHFYPGLFGSPSTIQSHARTIERDFPRVQAYIDEQNAPFLSGEFNVVHDRCGGERMMRRYYDECAARGWMATMWSYKNVKPAAGLTPNNWYLVTNDDSLPRIDIRNDSYETIESFMKSMATMKLVADEPLRVALTDPNYKPFDLPRLPELPKSAPDAQIAGEWSGVRVNTTAACGVAEQSGRLAITAGGADIFGNSDSFYFLQRATSSDQFLLTTTVRELVESQIYAKAGVMLRFGKPDDGEFASAPFAMVNVFPDGGVSFVTRQRSGDGASETRRYPGPLPRRIGLLRRGGRVRGLVEDGAGAWVSIGEMSLPANSSESRIGLAVCSHQGSFLTRATFDDLKFVETASAETLNIGAVLHPAGAISGNLLGAEGSWETWGELKRAAGADLPRFTFDAVVDSGAWREVKVRTGSTYRFSIAAARLREVAGERSGIVELRLESLLDGKQIAVASSEFSIAALETGDGRSTLSVSGQALSEAMRVLVRVNPVPRRATNAATPASLVFEQPAMTAVEHE